MDSENTTAATATGVVAPAETINAWCEIEALSKSAFYALSKKGLGPRTVRVPGTKIIRIVESHQSWRDRMAELAASAEAELETQRRRAQSREAGKVAAQSPTHVSHKPRKRQRRTA